MTRPTEIVWFERIIIGTLFLGALNNWLAWPQLVAMRGPAFLIAVQLFTLAFIMGLTLFISRRRSNIAKWISVGLFVAGLFLMVRDGLAGLQSGSPAIGIIQAAAQLVAYALLFTAASRRWLKREAAAA